MLTAVDLHDDLRRRTIEVHDEVTDHFLSVELISFELLSTNM